MNTNLSSETLTALEDGKYVTRREWGDENNVVKGSKLMILVISGLGK